MKIGLAQNQRGDYQTELSKDRAGAILSFWLVEVVGSRGVLVRSGDAMARLSQLAVDIRAAESARTRWRIVTDILRRKFGPFAFRDHVLYRCNRERYRAYPWKPKIGAEVRSYKSQEAVPEVFWKRLKKDNAISTVIEEFSRGAVLWVSFIGDKPAAYMRSIRASGLSEWYIPLAPDDVVLYGGGTFREWRGNGLHTDTMRHVIRKTAGDIYCDAHEWNAAAQRNFEKCGFVRIGRAPALA